MKKNKKLISKLVDPGIPYVGEMTGAAIASTVGFFVMGPTGAVIGAAGGKIVTDLFARAGEEMGKRYLSRRENARIGVVTIYALNRIKLNEETNRPLRNDDFFSPDSITNRSAADEILEGTLLAAKNEYEERKLKYYGNLLANIAYYPEIDRYQANYLLRITERLSYRQICILALFKRKSDYCLSSNFQELQKTLNPNELIVIREIEEIKISKLLKSINEALWGGGSSGNITPSELELSDTGNILYQLMNLDEIEKEQIDTLASILSDHI
jgi:hypothetical protein